jgi:hypothetical protein
LLRNINSRLGIGRNSQQRFNGEFSSRIRDVFRRSPKNKISHFSKEMTNLSTILIETPETLLNSTNNELKNDICLVSDSPHYIVRVRLSYI